MSLDPVHFADPQMRTSIRDACVARAGKGAFYAAELASALQLEEIAVDQELQRLVEQGELRDRVQIVCPECGNVLEDADRDEERLYGTRSCSYVTCGKQVTIGKRDVRRLYRTAPSLLVEPQQSTEATFAPRRRPSAFAEPDDA